MTFNEFIKKYDNGFSIILLEGKREVKEKDKNKLTELGKLLAKNTQKMIFRSGNADGADYYFSIGVSSIDKSRLQVITPYSNHRKKKNVAYETIPLDDINMLEEPEVIYQSKSNKKVEKIIDQFISGEVNRNSIKAAYILRDTIKVIGTKDVKPATFGIFYDDLANPCTGGTGHTMNVCKQNKVSIIDQMVWLKWLEEKGNEKVKPGI